jgi:hypothetical protein
MMALVDRQPRRRREELGKNMTNTSSNPLGLAATISLLCTLLAPPLAAQSPPPRDPRDRPTTLPSYPDQPGMERPRPNRPATLPSYPSRPSYRPPSRPILPPPIGSRPDVRWGYQYPATGGGFAGTLRCESRNGRYNICPARTRGRVVLERRHNGRCRFNEGWGYDVGKIWVARNCRATFAYGIGGYYPRYRSDRNDTALVIGGVAVAAGLVALLAGNDGKGNRASTGFAPQPTARIDADLDAVRASARPAYRQCLEKAASNIAATGGNRLKVSDVTIDSLNNDEYRFDVDMTASYPDKSRPLAFSCTATADKVEDFDFITEG